MVSIKDMINKLRQQKRESTINVPATFNAVEEAKIAEAYDEKDRTIMRQIKARKRNKFTYTVMGKDGQPKIEESAGDQVYRHGFEESMIMGGMLGEYVSPAMLRKQYQAWMKLRGLTEIIQARKGKDNPLFILSNILTACGKDNILPFTVTRDDREVNRVVIKSGYFNPFGEDMKGGMGDMNTPEFQERIRRLQGEKQRLLEEQRE